MIQTVIPETVQTESLTTVHDDPPASRPVATLRQRLEALERELIVEALRSARGNRAKAARILGITERIMGLRVKKYEIDVRDMRKT